jgi:hypothetical protein
VRLFYASAVLFVQVSALRRADPPPKESYRLCKRSRNWKAAKVQQRTIEPERERIWAQVSEVVSSFKVFWLQFYMDFLSPACCKSRPFHLLFD